MSRWAVCDTTGEGMGAPPGVVNDLRVCERLACAKNCRLTAATSVNALPQFLGVKWSQVQILSARRIPINTY
jgi:hypothetical protein